MILSTPSLGITRRMNSRSSSAASIRSFQLPLSGSLLDRMEKILKGRYFFQLPLSGSRARRSRPRPRVMGKLSTPSLGITCKYLAAKLAIQSFNSLSRDHLSCTSVLPRRLRICFQLPLSGSRASRFAGSIKAPCRLSTPSLGITGEHLLFREVQTKQDFQLPLSGSPSMRPRSMIRWRFRLSTPSLGITREILNIDPQPAIAFNSLSRDHITSLTSSGLTLFSADRILSTPSLGITRGRESVAEDEATLSTPSLGITTSSGAELLRRWRPSSFNSLSRDHRALFRDFPALRGFPPRHPFAHLYFPATI